MGRIASLDHVRALAIITVVLCHAVETVYSLFVADGRGGDVDFLFSVGFAIGRMGVPLFLFLSGALLLSKPIEGLEGVLCFYKRSLVPILLTTEVWVVLYSGFVGWLGGGGVNIESLLRCMLFIENAPVMNMWYMPMILGVYLAIPFLSMLTRSLPWKAFLIPGAVIFVIGFLFPWLKNVAGIFGEKIILGSVLNTEFLGGVYGFYLILGFFIYHKKILRKMPTSLGVVLAALSFIALVLVQYEAKSRGSGYTIWYNDMLLLFFTTCVFELYLRSRVFRRERVGARQLSMYSFAIFLLHPVVLMLLMDQKADFIKQLPYLVDVFILLIVALITSYAVAWVICRSKIAGKILFVMKKRT